MSEPIRLAIIGTGLIVDGKHWPALQMLGNAFHVVALANRTPAKAERLARTIRLASGRGPSVYTDYRELLEKERPDAVSLALPIHLNPEVVAASLAAGSHVIAEKPLAASLAEAARMRSWSAEYGRVLMIAENYRYLSSFRRAAALLAEDVTGPPATARWSLYPFMSTESPYYHTSWRQQPAHPGGYLSDAGVHHMAVLRMLLGEVDTLCATTAQLRTDLPPADTLSASLRFANGAVGTYAITYAVPGPESPLQIAGPAGTLQVTRDSVEIWQRSGKARAWSEPSPHDGLVAMYEDFARAMTTGQPPRSTAAESYADLQLIVAMLQSAQGRREVRVADITP